MNKKFLVGITLFAVAMFLLQYRMPNEFSWDASFSTNSRHPYGCRLFDSILSTSMPHGYTITAQTPWQLDKENSGPKSLIVHQQFCDDYDALLKLSRLGWRVLLLIDYGDWWLEDTLRCKLSHHAPPSALHPLPPTFHSCLHWEEENDDYADSQADFEVMTRLVGTASLKSDSCWGIPLLTSNTNADDVVIAMRFLVGEGELTVTSAPLLFTNYALLNDAARPVATRMLDRLKVLPVVRIDKTLSDNHRNTSTPLIVFLEQPPLRLAIYLTAITVVLFLLFTARRRQRIIPVIDPPQNNNLEFVRLIGTLYYHRGKRDKNIGQKLDETYRLYETTCETTKEP